MLNLPVPEAHFHNVVIKPSDIQKDMVAALSDRAKDIHDKYVDPPFTTDFAIMFLPFESIYAEVMMGVKSDLTSDLLTLCSLTNRIQRLIPVLRMSLTSIRRTMIRSQHSSFSATFRHRKTTALSISMTIFVISSYQRAFRKKKSPLFTMPIPMPVKKNCSPVKPKRKSFSQR